MCATARTMSSMWARWVPCKTRRACTLRRGGQGSTSAPGSSNEPGAMCCKQLMPDPDVAGRFYRTTFDGTPEPTDMGPAGSYTIFKGATTQVGGMMARPPQMKEVLPHWLTYVAVTDCDGSAKKVGDSGASCSGRPTTPGTWAGSRSAGTIRVWCSHSLRPRQRDCPGDGGGSSGLTHSPVLRSWRRKGAACRDEVTNASGVNRHRRAELARRVRRSAARCRTPLFRLHPDSHPVGRRSWPMSPAQ